MLVVTAIAAALLFFPDEFTNFGNSLFATSFFAANYHFMNDIGYFAAPAESKPLLHMWSLAVEEQFYLIYPIYLWLVWKHIRQKLKILTLGLCVLSFIYSVILFWRSPDQAFYSAPARAWELLAGALVALRLHDVPQRVESCRTASWLAMAGLLMILVSAFAYSEATPFPAMMALPPVFGAALFIHASRVPGTLAARLLSLAPIRYIGLVSFSLYLWHWPIFVFAKIYAVRPLTRAECVLLVVVSMVAALLSWRFVEQPLRVGLVSFPRRAVLGAGLMVMAVGIIVGAVLALGQGVPQRFSPSELRVLKAGEDVPVLANCLPLRPTVNGAATVQVCPIGVDGSKSPEFALWGDSHAEALSPAVAAAAQRFGGQGLAYIRGGCPPLLTVRQAREGFDDCNLDSEAFMADMAAKPNIRQVILVARWALYAMGRRFRSEAGHTVYLRDDDSSERSIAANQAIFTQGLNQTVERLTAMGKQVVLVSQIPEAEFKVPAALARAMHLNRNLEVAPRVEDYSERQAFVSALFLQQLNRPGVMIVHPEQALCAQDRCAVSVAGSPIYRDSNHLTATAARSLESVFEPLFAAIRLPTSEKPLSSALQ